MNDRSSPLIAIAAWPGDRQGPIEALAAVHTTTDGDNPDEFFAVLAPAAEAVAAADPYDLLDGDDEPAWTGEPALYDNYGDMLAAFERWYFHHAGYATAAVVAEDVTAGLARLFADMTALVCVADPWSSRHDTPHEVRTLMLAAGVAPDVTVIEHAKKEGLTGEEYLRGPLHDARLVGAVWQQLARRPA